ncbi:SDR family oxidoreductase [Pedobacter sp. UBA4863]|uniref:SDR family NAD(P)-dependent oxidoreductase n=1 Tax=Pedobacter sp. UBA4863 TaxID=1947060 RepID=UPI0025E2F087|nr:SDR family oxidoreductase [Pedobacter sp. UBA4863]
MDKITKVVIVTGASRGIGREIALKYAKEGFNVALILRNAKDIGDIGKLIQEKYNRDFIACIGDLSDSGFAKNIVDETLKKWGRIDVLVNNAAWRTIETMRTMSMETWNKTLMICLTAPAFLSKMVADTMEQLNIQGVVVNISSIMADRPAGNSPAYIAAKGAMDSLTRELAITYGRSGIRFLSVKPGNINTDMSADYVNDEGDNLSNKMSDYIVGATPLSRAGTSAEIASVVYWLSSAESAFVTGTSLVVDGGFSPNLNDYSIKKLQFPNQF